VPDESDGRRTCRYERDYGDDGLVGEGRHFKGRSHELTMTMCCVSCSSLVFLWCALHLLRLDLLVGLLDAICFDSSGLGAGDVDDFRGRGWHLERCIETRWCLLAGCSSVTFMLPRQGPQHPYTFFAVKGRASCLQPTPLDSMLFHPTLEPCARQPGYRCRTRFPVLLRGLHSTHSRQNMRFRTTL
jgi:hypothetical protein